MSATAERPVTADSKPDGTTAGPDADKGKLFEVPRVKIVVDGSDPTVIKLAFSGSVDLDRTVKQDADFFNQLKHGKAVRLEIDAHVAGSRKVHRRDSEGDVDAIVETKGLIVTDVHFTD